MTRRRALATIGAGAAMAFGIGGITGSALAWERSVVAFKGCSEVWVVVHPDDLEYGNGDDSVAPYPAVAHVIVATTDGDLECRVLEFTPETATTVPGQYGDAPLVKYAPPSGEKVLGVIIYNYTSGEDRFARESPLVVNDHVCANTPGTPDPHDAPCADNTYTRDRGHSGDDDRPGNGRGPPENDEEPDDDRPGNGRGPPKDDEESDDDRPGNGRGPPEDDEEPDDDRPGNGRGPPENPGRSNDGGPPANGRRSGRGR